MNMIASRGLAQDQDFAGTMAPPMQGVVAIVSDDTGTIERLTAVCEFLDLKVEIVSATKDLIRMLNEQRPMAVISDIDGDDQDGFHTMKVIARYDRDLPVMLLTSGDPVLMGAVDAIQDVAGLTSVTTTSCFPLAGQIVAFLFGAGRRTGCMRLVPV